MLPPLIAGNWKMHKTATEARQFVRDFLKLHQSESRVEVIMAPPFTSLHAVRESLQGTVIALSAQNVFSESEGPYTGEISPPMLKDLGCQYVIIGHSERRQHLAEDNQFINRKIHAALAHDLRPILCVGESIQQRESGQTPAVIERQLLEGMTGMSSDQVRSLTIAYEPVWAIGTGHAATVEQATEVHAQIATVIEHQWGVERKGFRILYGGSVSSDNADRLFESPQIDGALVGKACLNPSTFAKIISSAHRAIH